MKELCTPLILRLHAHQKEMLRFWLIAMFCPYGKCYDVFLWDFLEESNKELLLLSLSF